MDITGLPNATSTPAIKPRKSILKKSKKSEKSTKNGIKQINNSTKDLNCTKLEELSSIPILQKSYNLKEVLKAKKANAKNQDISNIFNIEDLSDSEDIWLMNVPKLVDPQVFCGQTLSLNNRSKFKVKDEEYSTTIHDADSVTCVFTTKTAQPKIVNVKPSGLLTVTKKKLISSEGQPITMDDSIIQHMNLIKRHPLRCNSQKYKKQLQKLGLLKTIY